MNTLLWGAQIVLAVLQLLNFLSALMLLLAGHVRNVAVAAASAGFGLILGLGIVVPWWSERAMILTPLAASILLLFALWDGLTKQGAPTSGRGPANVRELLEHDANSRFLRIDAIQLSVAVALAVVVAVGRFRAFGQWNNSLHGWLFVGGGTMVLVLCLLRSPEGPSRARWLQAGSGLFAILAGCLNMLEH